MRKWIFVLPLCFISFILFAPIYIDNKTYIFPDNIDNCKLNALQHMSAFCLQENLKRYVQMGIYKKCGKWSYCNVLAIDILDNRNHDFWGNQYGFLIDDYQYDISSIYKTAFSVLSVNIKTAYDRALKAIYNKKIKKLTQEQAYYEAQKGKVILIMSRKYNHMAIVFPEFKKYDSEKGVMVAQAGFYNGIFRISDYECFSYRWKDNEILFLEFPLRSV